MQCLGSRRAWEHSQRGHILSEKLSTGSQHDQMKKHLCFSPLQFARDVLRQSDLRPGELAGLKVAICAGCAEAKASDLAGHMRALVAICAGCAEAKHGPVPFSAFVRKLQFARDVLRQRFLWTPCITLLMVAICAGCAEAKLFGHCSISSLEPLQFARDVLRQSCA